MAKYFAIRQGEDESCTQYLIRVRDLLERGHSTSKLELIDAEGFHILLLKGLQDRRVRDRASKQVDKWTTMDDVFSSIMFYADQSNKTKIYAEPEYEGEFTIWVSEVHQRQGFHQYQPKGQSYTWKDGYQKQGHNKYLGSPWNQQQVDIQQHDKPYRYDDCKNNKDVGGLKWYHYEGPHYISQCEKYQKEKSRYQEKHQDIKKMMVSKLHRFVDNKCIRFSKAFFDKEDNQDSPAPQLTEEEINEVCQALEHSDSEWLWKEVKEIQVNKAETEDSRPILYKVQANGILVVALFDMDAGMSIMSSKFFRSIVNKPKVFKCNRKVRSVRGDTLVPIVNVMLD